MAASTRYRETCHGCNKNILKHHNFVTCKVCERICHGKCSDKVYSPIHKVGIENQFFGIKQTVTTFLGNLGG